MSYKNILFDLGGVLFDLDISKSEKAFQDLLGPDFEFAFYKENMSDVFKDFEKGSLTPDEFLSAIQTWATQPISKTAITEAWNAMLVGIPLHRFPFLESLSKKYNLYLLSNTNEIHLEWVMADIKNRCKEPNFDQKYFIKTYYSNLIKMRKPDVGIYNFVCKDAGILASETIFIDDNIGNIAGAKAAGLLTHWHDPKLEIIDFFEGK